MSKLTRSVSHPFTGGQPTLPPTEHRTIPSREDIVAFYRTHERVSWSLTEFLDTPWQAIQLEALTPADVAVVETTMLVESNSPEYVANLIEYFKADQDVCDFIMMWGMEEWKHYYALRDYLTKVRMAIEAGGGREASTAAERARLDEIETSIRAALTEDVDAVREASMENWGIPAHFIPAQLVASTTVQEFVTADFYRNHARHTQEPTLAKLEMLLAKDETRHEMFYEKRLEDCLGAEPDVLPLVLDALKEFGMPGAYLLDDYGERRAAMEHAAFPTLADKKGAFVRLFSKVERMVGHEHALAIFTEGNYLSDGVDDTSKKKMKPELITRLLTRRLG
ncbi:MAG TPA: acyl-ACP desaturase [Dehalococcoidia bacterium]|nr:acyl-ACP desaturase [Dehalococcoidia bacterium]